MTNETNQNIYLAAPKVATIYGSVAALIKQENDSYECLFYFRREWCTCLLSSKEVVTVHHSEQAALSVGNAIHEMAEQFSVEHKLLTLSMPLTLSPLSSQLKELTGEGYNCSWERIYNSQGNAIGEVNHGLKVAVAFHSDDLLKHSQRVITADSSGFNLEPLRSDYVYNLITPVQHGFASESVNTLEAAQELANQVREWDRTKHNRLTPVA